MDLIVHTLIKDVNQIALSAAALVLEYYHQGFNVSFKEDNSPVTSADRAAHSYICRELEAHWPSIPIVSEEGAHARYEVRRDWNLFWLVDPIDGTKEFVKKEGEFTINIALIRQCEVVLGVVVAPVLQKYYYGAEGVGSFVCSTDGSTCSKKLWSEKKSLQDIQEKEGATVLVSKSHREPEINEYLMRYRDYRALSVGSSLKFCVLAEGAADLYPRIATLCEWDIAAGHAVAKYSGKNVFNMGTVHEYSYNSAKLTVQPFEAY